PAELIGRSFAELADPLGPWLALAELGYSLWAITDSPAGAVLELAAPFPPPRRLALHGRATRPGRRDRVEHEVPRAIWSASSSALRLACARADAGAVRAQLPLLAADDEPCQPRLIHFAVYGG